MEVLESKIDKRDRVESTTKPIHTYCAINNTIEAAIVSEYLRRLMDGESGEDFVFIRLAEEAKRIHRNRYNHLCEKIKLAIEEMEEQKSGLGFTSSYVCMEKTIKRKVIVKNKKTYVEETTLNWHPRIFQTDIDKLLEVKKLYDNLTIEGT